VRRLLARLARDPGRLAGVLVLTLLAGMVEGVGLLLLIPLLAIVGVEVPVDGPLGSVAAGVEGALAGLGLPLVLPVVLAVYVAVVAGQSGLRYLERVRSTALVEDLKADLRERVFGAVVRADWPYHLRTRGSDLLQVLNDEVYRVGDASTQALTLLTTGVTAGVYLAVAFYLSPLATGVAAVTALLLLVLLRARAARSRAAGEAWSEASEGVYFTASEFLAGLKTAKSHAAEGRHTRAFGRETRRLADSWVQSARSYADVQFFFTTGAVVVLSLLVWAALEVIRLEAAALLVLIFIFLRLIPRFSSLQNGLQYLANALPALDRVDRVLAEAGAAVEVGVAARAGTAAEAGEGGPDPLLNDHDHVHPHLRAPLAEGIRVDGVTYAYPPGLDGDAEVGTTGQAGVAPGARPGTAPGTAPGTPPAPVLHDVTLEIPARRTTALVGVSGGGKTTLADLLLGLLRPDQGRILVDGTPLDQMDLAAWRRGIGYVAQESFLFNDTIRQNLLPDEGAPDEELLEALRTARLDDFVTRLPAGLDTVVGERGVRLSGGERQRLALARALVRRPRLLVLDEATSALDYENEALIRQALERLHGETTVVMITHRLPLARSADRVYVLDRGRVVQSGTWNELATADGRFRELVASGAGEAPGTGS
jgi:ATP-binding cassette, subfamily C, bacterial